MLILLLILDYIGDFKYELNEIEGVSNNVVVW